MSQELKVSDVKQLAELLTSRDGAEEREKIPDFQDPTRYPRHARIEDPEALARIAKLDEMLDEMRRLARKAEILNAKMTVTREELFEGLEGLHPDILKIRRGGVGLRDWKGEWFYIGWDRQRYQGENLDAAGNPTGQYL